VGNGVEYVCASNCTSDIISANGFDRPSIRIHLGFRAGMNKPRRATVYTVLLKDGFSLDFQAFSEFDNIGCKTGYFSGITELHNKKG
jgi:hypothetical protein